MNRKQKIIVSITGITIVMLALVGLTYGYYLTVIKGNEKEKSISVTTTKLEIEYSDNSAEIIQGTGSLKPTLTTDAQDAIGTKTFTVTNKGNDMDYLVVIDNVTITNAKDGSDTVFESNDFRYTLTCTKKDGTKCDEVNELSVFPIDGGTLIENNIKAKDVHTYTLTLWYIDTGLNQSNDMGKTYQARVNIDEKPVSLTAEEFLELKDENNIITLIQDTILTTKMALNSTANVSVIDLDGHTLTMDPDTTTEGYQGAYPIEIYKNIEIKNGSIIRGEKLTAGSLLIAYDNVNLTINNIVMDGKNIPTEGTNRLATGYSNTNVWCKNCNSLAINNSELKNGYGNTRGVGVTVSGAQQLNINNSKIYNNKLISPVTGHGGAAILVTDTENVNIQNSRIFNNFGNENTYGTVAIMRCGNFTFDKDSKIENNISAEGSGLYIQNSSGTISGQIIGNKTTAIDGNGGGVYSLLSESSQHITITETAVIKENEAAAGGGIYVNGPTNGVVPGKVTMTGGSITGNKAVGTPAAGTLKDGGGAGIYVARGIMEITGGRVENNVSTSNVGNAILISNTGKNTEGGKLTISGGTILGSVTLAETYGTLTLNNVTQNGEAIS